MIKCQPHVHGIALPGDQGGSGIREWGRWLLQGDPIAIDGIRMSPATLLTELNKVAGDNGAWLRPCCRASCSSSGKVALLGAC
jgi:hypothetical protein